jgi:hypothetical protein
LWIAGVSVALGLTSACSSDTGGPVDSPSRTSSRPTTTPTSGLPTTGAPTSDAPESEEDAIGAFFDLVDEGRAADAVLAMSSSVTGDDSAKQAWAVQLAAMTSVKVLALGPSMPVDWTATRHTYRVTLDVRMSPGSSTAPIPYYGYTAGENVRFVSVVAEDGAWKVDTIGTGP